MSASSLVTIAIPVYRRLDCLHIALRSVADQDYDDIELIVSDNGQNGTRVREIVSGAYPKPFTFRQNPRTVPLPDHYSQLLAAASGFVFIFLPDDDAMTPNYVSAVVRILANRHDVSVVIAKQEEVSADGRLIRSSPGDVDKYIEGIDFVKQWTSHGFASYTPIAARTKDIRSVGGYLDCPWGGHSDNALMLKLCLSGTVAYATTCTYHLRYDPESFGWSLGVGRFAQDTNCFLRFLEKDPWLREYSERFPDRWKELKPLVSHMAWKTYLDRWRNAEHDAPFLKWAGAGFAIPFFPEYYRAVVRAILSRGRRRVLRGR